MKMILQLGVILFSFLSGAQCVYAATPGIYLGGGLGLAHIDDTQEFNRMDDSVLGGRVFLGYNFAKYFGVETNYAPMNKTRFSWIEYPEIIGNYSLSAVSVVGKLYLPLSTENTFNLYALAGAAQMSGKFNVEYQNMSFLEMSASEIVPTAGVGLTFDLNNSFTAGLELSGFGSKSAALYQLGIPGSTLATLSLAYKFQ